ncbi:YqzE family protein [Paenibacillus cremeus]|uniref:YqzE family protein n=1 Tax=Paenibacillus cremeus TaxID=2163881 RepID=A0A559K860_9BACL|nr:YqzE family protein [Paenibacillus cremeus]TVY08307.1 YqzE family protein [Paenibacillus cremeus]
MAKSDELVKFLTQQVVKYIETPKDVRKQVRAGRREVRERWSTRWFGMLPLALRMWYDRVLRRKAK